MCIMWESKGNKTLFRLNGEEALLIVTPEGMTDTFEEKEEGVFLWHRTTEEPVVSMCMEAETLFIPEHTMVPAVSYDGNPWGKDHEYKGLEKMERPIPMPFIAVRYPERPVPGMKNWESRCSAQAPVPGVCRNQRKVICITVFCGRRKKGRRCFIPIAGDRLSGEQWSLHLLLPRGYA